MACTWNNYLASSTHIEVKRDFVSILRRKHFYGGLRECHIQMTLQNENKTKPNNNTKYQVSDSNILAVTFQTKVINLQKREYKHVYHSNTFESLHLQFASAAMQTIFLHNINYDKYVIHVFE